MSTPSLFSCSLTDANATPHNRHHVFVKTSHREVQLAEVGPRFEMRPYEIRQGTLEQSEADVEWQLRPFMNSGRKKNQL